jgi:hypothetical protein
MYVPISQWFNYFEGVALATLFLLICEYISPRQTERELFFAALKIEQRKGPMLTGNASIAWYQVLCTQFQILTAPQKLIQIFSQNGSQFFSYPL